MMGRQGNQKIDTHSQRQQQAALVQQALFYIQNSVVVTRPRCFLACRSVLLRQIEVTCLLCL